MFLTSDSRDFQVVDLGEATALVAELAGDVLPGRLLEHVARTVGDLLIDAAFLARVDFALAKLLLDGVETCCHRVSFMCLYQMRATKRQQDAPLSR